MLCLRLCFRLKHLQRQARAILRCATQVQGGRGRPAYDGQQLSLLPGRRRRTPAAVNLHQPAAHVVPIKLRGKREVIAATMLHMVCEWRQRLCLASDPHVPHTRFFGPHPFGPHRSG
eukprot:354169-Chlamydomonas_euryale.AAC.31